MQGACMWPWEHALFAYLLYSIASRLLFRRPPGGAAALAVAIGAVAPDLIDKPLAWQFGVFSSGYALAHSVFFAVPLSVFVVVLARRAGRGPIGYAMAVGYLSHLVSDVIPIYAEEGELSLVPVLWPLGDRSTTDHSQGFLNRFMELFWPYVTDLQGELLTFDPSPYTLFQLSIVAFAAVLWIADGMPVLSDGYAGLKARLSRNPSERTVE